MAKKDYICPCGKMKVTFPGNSVVRAQGAWCYGSPTTHLRCFTRDCPGKVRIAYDIHHVDKEGNVFHSPKKRQTKSRVAPRKKNKPKSKPKEQIEWSFD